MAIHNGDISLYLLSKYPVCQAFSVPVGDILHRESHPLSVPVWYSIDVHAVINSGESPPPPTHTVDSS